MKKAKIKLYSLDELSKDAQQRAISYFSESNVSDGYWSEFVCEDAKNIGINIKSFDLDRQNIEGEFITSAGEVFESILSEHGKDCETFKTAKEYKNAFQNTSDEVDEDELSDKEDEFLKSILEDYRIMLQHEYDYQQSEEAAKETIEANEYLFFADGELANVTHYCGKHPKAGKTELNFHGEIISL